MKTLSQEQLDNAIRKAKGRNAVEAMVREDNSRQIYLLSDGTLLEVSKTSGLTVRVQGELRAERR